MKSSKLPPVLNINECRDINSILEVTYNNFKNHIMDKNKRPKLFNKPIFIDFNNWIDHKAEMHWHMISLAVDEKFNILPCNNDISSMYKMDNCITNKYQVTMSNGQVRNICLYRAIRINWFNDIIKLTNNGDESIRYWEKDRKLYIRFQHETVDYAIVFQIQRNTYRLLSMFPVFYINKKQTFNTDYNKYMQNKKR
jgi:hypothetical protein